MKSIRLTAFLLLGASMAWGQSPLTLEDCRTLAVTNNKRLKIADTEVKISQAQREEAFTKYLPSVDVSGVYLRNQKEIHLLEQDAYLPVGTIGENGKWTLRPDQVQQVNGQPVPKDYALLPREAMSVDDRNTAVLQLGLTQPLYIGGKIRAYNQLARLSEELSANNRRLELQNVLLSVDEAYWQVVSLVNRKKLADKYVATLKKFEHDVEMMYKTGVSTKADVLSVKVKLNEAEMNQLKVEDGLSLSRMQLNQICGLSTDSVYLLKDEEMEESVGNQIGKISLEQIYLQRPEILSLELATRIYQKKEKIALADYLPSVALTANYLTTAPSFYDGVSTKFDGMWSIGVGIKAAVFHWGASRKTLRKARAQTGIMRYKLEEAREKIELQVSQAEFKVKEVARKVEMARYNMQKAEENLKLATWGFQEGTIPVLNVLEAQTAWLSAQTGLIDARIESRLCEVYLRKAYGILEIEN